MNRIGAALGGTVILAVFWPLAAIAQNLSAAEVTQITNQAVQEAQARGRLATIAVVDRVGNVLAVFDMNGALTEVTITSQRAIGVGNGLERVEQTFDGVGAVNSPSTRLAAIAKAVTAAYLSSSGNAFTTRTASQIIQEHFNPGETFSPSGPLFGVQFSQLPCSDLAVRQATNNATPPGLVDAEAGPKRAPLGLSADPGGLPLYKGAQLVGGVGIEANGVYTLDGNIGDFDKDDDEIIALAGQSGFEPSRDIRANRIFLDGKSLRYIDASQADLLTNPSTAPAAAVGALVAVTGYAAAAIAGQTFGSQASGIAADNAGTFDFVGQSVFILFDGAAGRRFPPTDSTTPTVGAGGLTANEVTTILGNAAKIAFAARSQIRKPLGSHAQVTISVVDANGNVLGIARTPDAPVFGTDVSLQKARTAALFSSQTAGTYLTSFDSTGANNPPDVAALTPAAQNLNGVVLANFVTLARAFIGSTALADGTAFSDRSGGNLSRPYFPDGIDGVGQGPFSRQFRVWSPFNTGLQLDSVIDNVAQHILFADGAVTDDSAATCASFDRDAGAGTLTRVANGFQIFPGSVPIYRGGVVIGGIGVSGDGVDQDDMIGFLGLNDAANALGTGFGNAPAGLRADNLAPQGVRLRFVNCPFRPFLGSRDRNVCRGK